MNKWVSAITNSRPQWGIAPVTMVEKKISESFGVGADSLAGKDVADFSDISDAEVEEDEIVLVLTACNNVTREIKMAKVFLERSLKAVSASCEFYYTDEEVIRLNLSHALTILGMVRSIFRNTKAELAGN